MCHSKAGGTVPPTAFGYTEPGATARGSHPGCPIPRCPRRYFGKEGNAPSSSVHGHFIFFKMSEMKQIGARRVMVTALRKVLTATKWVIMICFSSQIIAFPDIYMYIMPNFPLQGAI